MANFEDYSLNPQILKSLAKIGFETPTPIQEKTLSLLLETPRDLIAIAQTGTGKTAAFSLPMLEHIVPEVPKIQALVLSPTRELAVQIGKDVDNYAKYIKGFKCQAVYGGTSIMGQIKELKARPQMVVGTPGRTLDLIKRRKLDLSEVRWVVLDEADEMLSMGFKDDLNEILSSVPEDRITLLFSATLAKDVRQIANDYLTDPEEITIGRKNTGASNVKHGYFQVKAKDRYKALKRIVDANPGIYGIVFCRTRAETKELAASLTVDGYNSDAIHGDLSQAQRDYVMDKFRKRQLQLLVATDVAARGIDVNDLTHVIHYKLPDDREVFVHRSGRTGRAGKDGISLAIIHGREKSRIQSLSKMIGKSIDHMPLPSGKDICKKQLFELIEKVDNVTVDESEIAEFLPMVEERLSQYTREELVKRFVSVEFNRFLAYYKDAEDLNDNSKSGKKDRKQSDLFHFSRFFINLGKKQDMRAKDILQFINENHSVKSIEVGQIEVLKGFSFFEVDKRYAKETLEDLNGQKYKGLSVRIETAESKGSKSNDSGDRRGRFSKRKSSFRGKGGSGSGGGGRGKSRNFKSRSNRK